MLYLDSQLAMINNRKKIYWGRGSGKIYWDFIIYWIVSGSCWVCYKRLYSYSNTYKYMFLYDFQTGKKLHTTKEHENLINDMQMSKDSSMFITASKDHTAKLFDSDNLMLLKTYKTERPVNSAAVSPILEHVVLGGGQDAMDVTTTSARVGKFDSRFFHLVFEEEFGRVKGHFGPINSVAFHPDGKGYSSGGEDGYVRVHNFDPSYFEYGFDY